MNLIAKCMLLKTFHWHQDSTALHRNNKYLRTEVLAGQSSLYCGTPSVLFTYLNNTIRVGRACMYLDKPGITLSSIKMQTATTKLEIYKLQAVTWTLTPRKRKKLLKLEAGKANMTQRFWDGVEDVSHVGKEMSLSWRQNWSEYRSSSLSWENDGFCQITPYSGDYSRILALLWQHMQHKWEFFKN